MQVEANQTSQATVTEHIEDRMIITVAVALGARESAISDQWLDKPDVPGPGACPQVSSWRDGGGGRRDRFEVRLATGRYPDGTPPAGRNADGRVQFWLRSREGIAADALLLAIAADYVSVAIGHATGQPGGGNSLDNTIRYARIEPCEWILCDVRIETVHHGVVHGGMHLFSESGALMATASQSLILRLHDTGPPAA